MMLLLLLTTMMMMMMMKMVALMSVDVVLTWRQTDSVQSSPASATTCERRTVSQFHRRSAVFFCFWSKTARSDFNRKKTETW